jgi:hypothetical protein
MTNKRRNNTPFSDADIQMVWEKGQIVLGSDSKNYRKDACGALIKRSEYGNVNSNLGWEIDHIKPLAANGTDDPSNLQPLQWDNNRYKGDNFPTWYCKNRG